MPGYINLLQGKIARFEEGKTSKDIEGFFTDGVTSCCIVIFSGKMKGKRRLSALHSDGNLLFFNEEKILQEKDWVGDLEKCTIYRIKFYDQTVDGRTHLEDVPRPIIKFLLNHLKDTNIPLHQTFFEEENYGEMSFTFDKREPYGYKFLMYNFGKFPVGENIISHPDTLKIYSYYKLNSILQEQHSNMMLKTDPVKQAQWNRGQMSSVEKERAAVHADSSVTHNPIIFDGERFVMPGIHDMSLTKFSMEFLKTADAILAESPAQLTELQREYQRIGKFITLEQCAAVQHLMNIYNFNSGSRGREEKLETLYNECTMISDLYVFINSDFNLKSIEACQDEALKFLLSRYTKSLVTNKRAPVPDTSSAASSSTSPMQTHEDNCFWVRHTDSKTAFENMKKDPRSITTFPTKDNCFSSKDEAIKFIGNKGKNGYKNVFIFTMKGSIDNLVNQQQFTSDDFICFEDRTPAPEIKKKNMALQQSS